VVLADHLIGGSPSAEPSTSSAVAPAATSRAGRGTWVGRRLGHDRRRLRPAPAAEHLLHRDSSAWLYGGVVVNPMYGPRAGSRPLNVEAVSTASIRSSATRVSVLVLAGARRVIRSAASAPRRRHDADRQRTCFIGMSERTTGHMMKRSRSPVCPTGAADRVIAAGIAGSRPHAFRHGFHVPRQRLRNAVPVRGRLDHGVSVVRTIGPASWTVRREPRFSARRRRTRDQTPRDRDRRRQLAGPSASSGRGTTWSPLEPGVVVATRNESTNELDAGSRNRGPHPRRVPSSAAAVAGGHCMTCPLLAIPPGHV